MYRIHQIKLKPGESKDKIPEKIQEALGKKGLAVAEYRILRESIDARKKNDIRMVYSVDFRLTDPRVRLPLEKAENKEALLPSSSPEGFPEGIRPVVTGFGPAGIFAALTLAGWGLRPIVLERGRPVEERALDVAAFWKRGILNPESNVQFGEGGAGTFSDGKLTTGIKDPRISKVIRELAAAGGGEEILYRQKPHIGTDLLRTVVRNLRLKICSLGGEIRFSSRMDGWETEPARPPGETGRAERFRRTEGAGEISAGGGTAERLRGLWVTPESGDAYFLPAPLVILAPGHSARDTLRMAREKGLAMEQKPFSIGLRIEHPQEQINRAQYGEEGAAAGLLPPAEYKLSYRCANGRGVYTFCMCPGGTVIVASSSPGTVVTNGMSNHARNGPCANSGLLVDVRTEDFGSADPLAGIAFQETYEKLAFRLGGGNYRPPRCTLAEFAGNRGDGAIVRRCLPGFAVEALLEALPALGKKLRGFDDGGAVLTAVESRSSSPVRLLRDENRESSVKGLFPAGEGAGYAGGITSAAADGIRAAEALLAAGKART